jgi:uncharacterized BrkB/YihY/UPF0761 family membrane protein
MIDLPKALDKFQYRHRPLSFLVAVIKRYGDDNGGRSAALITYYLFLSIFPLLLWLSLFAKVLNTYFPGATTTLIHGATNYFPVLGQQLYKVAHSAHRSTSGIVLAGLVAIYGARGAALVFREIVNDIFGVPKTERAGFPWNWIRAIGIVIFGGGGFVLTAAITSWALGQGHSTLFRIFIGVVDIGLLALVFTLILRLSLPSQTRIRRILAGSLSMAVSLSVLQIVGGYIVTHELKHYTDTYTSLFATTLGLIAWIYLEAQILIYAIEVTMVAGHRLWPIHLFSDSTS